MIIPKPLDLNPEPGAFTFVPELTVWLDYHTDPGYAYFVADELTQVLRIATGRFVTVRSAHGDATPPEGSILLTDKDHQKDLGPEGYTLHVTPAHLSLRAGTNAGLFYAGQSLIQMLDHHLAQTDSQTLDQVPCVLIQDKPRFGWRGFMLDSVRHFQPIELVYKIVNQLAALKINRFHWHLTDDQGWRFESLGYPRLNTIGSWRDNEEGGRYGGYYTREQVRGLIEHARLRNITVIPEFDMPGHCLAALAAYPELGCKGADYRVQVTFGVEYGAFCAGNEKVYHFIEGVLGEWAEVFNAPYIHLGGDERKPGLWESCDKCRDAIDRLELADENALQKYFMDRVSQNVHESLCRRSIVWGDNIDAGSTEGQIVQGWLPGQAVTAARQGHDVINSIHDSTYLNYTNTPEEKRDDMPDWLIALPLEKVHAFDPIPADLEPELHKHVLGSESHLWTEFVEDEAALVHHLVPRLHAYSEAVWTEPAGRDFTEFKQRLKTQRPILNCAVSL